MAQHRFKTYWHGQAIDQLSRRGLEDAAVQAINELMSIAEREKSKAQHELTVFMLFTGAALAALGAVVGILLRG